MDLDTYDETYGDTDTEDQAPKGVRISLHMIQRRNLPDESKDYSQEKIVQELNKITHLRLDREHIKEIDNLELLGNNVTNVYLQQNLITEIDNLECLPNLWFLCLAGNKISKIQGLSHLSKLAFLDLSENKIEDFDIDELPQSLKILDLKGNPCTSKQDYRGRILQDMPNLQQLDGHKVTREERRESGYVVSSESESDDEESKVLGDEDFEEEEEILTAREKLEEFELRGKVGTRDSIQQITNEMLERSQDHLEGTVAGHRRRMAMLDALRMEKQLPPSSRQEKMHKGKSMGWTPDKQQT